VTAWQLSVSTAQFCGEITHFLHNGPMKPSVVLETYLALVITTHDASWPSSS